MFANNARRGAKWGGIPVLGAIREQKSMYNEHGSLIMDFCSFETCLEHSSKK